MEVVPLAKHLHLALAATNVMLVFLFVDLNYNYVIMSEFKPEVGHTNKHTLRT